MESQRLGTYASGSGWRSLYRVGGVAALTAGILFRRNLGPEISLFGGLTPPSTVAGWFTLLEHNAVLGLSFLNAFDVVDYALVGVMFLALYPALRKAGEGVMVLASALGLTGVGVYFASNTAFSMLFLSRQYTAAATEAQRQALLTAGQAVLAYGEGTGVHTSFMLVAVAGLMASSLMLRSSTFSRATAYAGILAASIDLAHFVALVFAPWVNVYLLSAAGLLTMVWHILIGWRLLHLGGVPQNGGLRQ